MTLVRPRQPSARVTLVPLIDVLFILLVYFMVTSVYLDLDMIPAGGTAEDPDTGSPAPTTTTDVPADGTSVLLRIDADGRAILRGQALGPEELRAALAEEIAERPTLTVMILPSSVAPVQALATTLDMAAQAGVLDTRLIRIEAEP